MLITFENIDKALLCSRLLGSLLGRAHNVGRRISGALHKDQGPPLRARIRVQDV
jgi:hypothetical protein